MRGGDRVSGIIICLMRHGCSAQFWGHSSRLEEKSSGEVKLVSQKHQDRVELVCDVG